MVINIKEEKPKYGWYVRDLILYFFLLGMTGLILFVSGFYIRNIIGIILGVIGLLIILIFLWPAIGLSTMQIALINKINTIDVIGKDFVINKIENPLILDIGCGTGRAAIKIAKELKNGGHLYGIDIYEKMAISGNSLYTVQNNAKIEAVEEKTTFLYGSATKIPFEEDYFDMVNISSVLHEIHNSEGKEKALKEIYRVLKKGGYAYISEWNRNSWQLISTLGIFCFVFKEKNYWQLLIEKTGFKTISYQNQSGFGLFIVKK